MIKRLRILQIIVSLGLLCSLLLSKKLWNGNRVFPEIPPLSFFSLDPVFTYVLFLLLICLLLAAPLLKNPKKVLILCILSGLILGLGDQMRWQPWFYQYILLLCCLVFVSWKETDSSVNLSVLNLARLIIVSTYFFSGLQKINTSFFEELFPWMISPLAKLLPSFFYDLTPVLGLSVPIIEMSIGLLLLSARFKNVGILLSASTHSFVLLTLGPLGHNHNSVVWPWNATMFFLVLALFLGDKSNLFPRTIKFKLQPFQAAIVTLMAIMPFFSFINLWDSYLSWALYSGNLATAKIYVGTALSQRLPSDAQPFLNRDPKGALELDFKEWSFKELNVPTYPESRIFKAIARWVCSFSEVSDEVTLEIRGKPALWNQEPTKSYTCMEI